jgi:hypothetical protein
MLHEYSILILTPGENLNREFQFNLAVSPMLLLLPSVGFNISSGSSIASDNLNSINPRHDRPTVKVKKNDFSNEIIRFMLLSEHYKVSITLISIYKIKIYLRNLLWIPKSGGTNLR